MLNAKIEVNNIFCVLYIWNFEMVQTKIRPIYVEYG